MPILSEHTGDQQRQLLPDDDVSPAPKVQFTYLLAPLFVITGVVSVLISVTSDLSPTGNLLAAFILYWGSVRLIWLRGLHVLHQDSTFPGCTASFGVTCVACRCQDSLLSDIHFGRHLVMAAWPAINVVVNNYVN